MGNSKSKHNKSFYIVASLAVLLFLSSIMLYYYDYFAVSNVYLGVTAFHIIIGIIIFFLVVFFLVFHLKLKQGILSKKQSAIGLITLVTVLVCIGTGLALTFFDLNHGQRWIRLLHPISAILCIVFFFWHKSFRSSFYKLNNGVKRSFFTHPFQASLIVGLLVLSATIFAFIGITASDEYITLAPDALLPGEARLAGHSFLDADALDGSVGCSSINCHPDIYEQWNESMHHFSSFNNPYYSKSIGVLRNSGQGASARWCASCHDPLPLLSGKMQGNLADFDPDSHLAQSGITCLACHAINEKPHIKGNGKYKVPKVASFNKLGEPLNAGLHKILLGSNSEPHSNAMMDPMMNTAEFCVSCHKVSIPPEVNGYRWKRGQNQYDSWQRSGVSGNNIRAFYFPEAPKNCISCHMPNVPSDDKGNKDGFVRSHRFAGANTAVPYLNGHNNQLKAVTANLMNDIVELDLIKVKINNRNLGNSQPLPIMQEGDEVDLALLVNNRKVGHRLPAGTNDTNEWWVEVRALDENNKTILASGIMDELGRVDSTSHFLRTILIDKKGNIIDKRNVNDMYATAYNNTVAPGTAQLVRFHFSVPDGVSITSIKASLKQRKFNWFYDNFTFNGVLTDANQGNEVSSQKKIWILPNTRNPEIPITTVATTARSAHKTYTTLAPAWKRWNDYGIGLFLEGNAKKAYEAFSKVDQLNKNTADGIINMARVLIDEGSVNKAIELLEDKTERFPDNKRIAFFLGKAYQALGEYQKAVHHWMNVYEDSRTDFALLLDIANAHYLLGDYGPATEFTSQASAIDPENFTAIYQQMLIYQAQGKKNLAEKWKEKYEYYRVNEKEEFVVANFLDANPQIKIESNNTHYHYLTPVKP